jgi:predicted N-acetyltransferase YhbS
MLIEKIPEWQLSARDDAEIATLLARCFDTDFGGRSFFSQPHHLRLIHRQGPIVAHMALLLRAVQLGERQFIVAGLAEVATDPDHRGQGIAAGLLQTAIAEATTSPAQFLLLFGTAKLYSSVGFRSIPNRIVSLGNDGSLMMLALKHHVWSDTDDLDLKGPPF